MNAEGLPPRDTPLTLLPAAVAVVLRNVVGMILTAHLLGKILFDAPLPSLTFPLGITLPVPCLLGLMIILPPERTPPTVLPILVTGMPSLRVSCPQLMPLGRRRSQSPPPRSSSSAYDPGYQGGAGGPPYNGGGPPAGYTGGSGYSGSNPPPRNAGGARDYPPRASRDNTEPPPGYRRL